MVTTTDGRHVGYLDLNVSPSGTTIYNVYSPGGVHTGTFSDFDNVENYFLQKYGSCKVG
jgi:hypothetical protein